MLAGQKFGGRGGGGGPGFPLQVLGVQGGRLQMSSQLARALGFRVQWCNLSVGDRQNCGPFSGTLNIRCHIVIGIRKGTMILITTPVESVFVVVKDDRATPP